MFSVGDWTVIMTQLADRLAHKL